MFGEESGRAGRSDGVALAWGDSARSRLRISTVEIHALARTVTLKFEPTSVISLSDHNGGKKARFVPLGKTGIEPMPSGPNRSRHRFHLDPIWLTGRIFLC